MEEIVDAQILKENKEQVSERNTNKAGTEEQNANQNITKKRCK